MDIQTTILLFSSMAMNLSHQFDAWSDYLINLPLLFKQISKRWILSFPLCFLLEHAKRQTLFFPLCLLKHAKIQEISPSKLSVTETPQLWSIMVGQVPLFSSSCIWNDFFPTMRHQYCHSGTVSVIDLAFKFDYMFSLYL